MNYQIPSFNKDPKEIIKKYLLPAIILVAVFGGGFFLGQKQVVCQICTPSHIDFSLFWDAYDKLHENYIDPSAITDQEIMYGAIWGMTKSLGDPYTDFFDPAQAKQFQEDLSGSFGGIGVEIGIKKSQLTVIAPLKNTPGERAGLKAGDMIVNIDGKSTFDMTTDEAVNLIRGKEGTQVTLGIFREGFSEAKDFTITRETIKIISIEWELKEGDVAHITIHHFDQSLLSEFRKTALEVMASPAKRIVLDLRNNPGGDLEVSQDVAGWFLQKGQVVTIEDFGDKKPRSEYLAQGNAALAHYPLVVLINQGSASASEILAGALRDNRGIQLIGEKSFGKGSVQEVVTLRDGKSFLKVTIAKWLTPNGDSISEVGLTPDTVVELTEEDFNEDRDPQLQKALEIIKGMN